MTHFTKSPDKPQFKPQTYEEWKAAHGWQPEAEPRLEIGQRVEDCAGNLGTIIEMCEPGLYDIEFDDGVIDALQWTIDYTLEFQPVGKSPSQLAHEQSERERLAAYQQLSLFDAAQTGGAE